MRNPGCALAVNNDAKMFRLAQIFEPRRSVEDTFDRSDSGADRRGERVLRSLFEFFATGNTTLQHLRIDEALIDALSRRVEFVSRLPVSLHASLRSLNSRGACAPARDDNDIRSTHTDRSSDRYRRRRARLRRAIALSSKLVPASAASTALARYALTPTPVTPIPADLHEPSSFNVRFTAIPTTANPGRRMRHFLISLTETSARLLDTNFAQYLARL